MRGRCTVLAGLATVWLTSGAALLAASDPCQFSATEVRAAEKQYPGYWYDQYGIAVDLIEKSKGTDEAIARLRVATRYQPEGQAAARHPISKEGFPYFPYYYLARAYSARGDFKSAQACLSRESKSIGSSPSRKAFEDLARSVEIGVSGDVILAQADRVLGWESGSSSVDLGSEGRSRLSVVRERRKAGAAGPAEVTSLRTAVVDVCQGAFGAQGGTLGLLSGPTWKQVFTDAPDLVDAAACQPPRDDGTAGAIARIVDGVERCGQVVHKAIRHAGAAECGLLGRLRKDVEGLSNDLRSWGELEGSGQGAAEGAAEPPKHCIDWVKTPPVGVREAFAGLDGERTKVRQALEAGKTRLARRLEEKRVEIRASLDAALSRLPAVSADCAQDLQLGEVARRLKSQRDALTAARAAGGGAPTNDLKLAGATSDALVSGLRGRIESGVQQLQHGADCEGIDRAALEPLPGALTGYMKSGAQQDLDALCGAARRAEAAIQEGCARSCETIRAGVSRGLTLLEAAGRAHARWMQDSPRAEDAIDCADKALVPLRAAQAVRSPCAAAAAWVRQARPALRDAQTCLQDLAKRSEAAWPEVARRVRHAREMFDMVEGVTEAGPIRQELRDLDARLGAVATLYQDKEGRDAAGLRALLKQAELDGNITPDLWSHLDGVAGGSGQRDDAAWKVIRDTAILPDLLARASRTLKEWEPRIRVLGAAAALSGAFAAYAGGDLDGAILALREAGRQGTVPKSGKEAAMVYAALAYFLHLKGLALASEDGATDIVASVRDEARQAARLAAAAEAGFLPPADLFPGRSFREAFRTYTQARTPEGA